MPDNQLNSVNAESAEHFPPKTPTAFAAEIVERISMDRALSMIDKNTEYLSQNDQFNTVIHRAAEAANVGNRIPPMQRFPSPLRSLALFAGRVVRYLARFITEEQQTFNQQVVLALQLLRDQQPTEKNLSLLNWNVVNDLRMNVAVQARSIVHLRGLVTALSAVREIGEKGAEQLKQSESSAMVDDEHFYLALEDRFRGSREEIGKRLRSYLKYIRQAGAGTLERPVLDLGCGRGEWLDLLREEGLVGLGVDQSRQMVDFCRVSGLNAEQKDLLEYLRIRPNASAGAITAFQVVEHLPINVLREMLSECLRVLVPGGVVVFETPNPGNITVATNNFYFDPTHIKPLPSLFLQFIVEYQGFSRAEIQYCNPQSEPDLTPAHDVERRIIEGLCGPMDYSVIGWRS